MSRAKNGEAISADGRTPYARRKLRLFIKQSLKKNRLDEWRRGVAVLGYIKGTRVVDIAQELDVGRGTVNRWLGWYESSGIDGLYTGKAEGASPKLTEEEQEELVGLIDQGPIACGYQSGVWTGPMIGDLIEDRFGVRYHNHHVPKLLHRLGFSVQRPRKRLARANKEAQETWIREKFPSIKKKRAGFEV